jgi:hypothetical protein
MSYSSITATQFVSRNNLQDAVNTAVITLNAGQTIPTGNRFVTKQDALTYTNIDPNNIFLLPKTNLQIIAKRDITPLVGFGIVELEVSNQAELVNVVIPDFVITSSVTSTNSPYFGFHSAFTGTLQTTVRSAQVADSMDLIINGSVVETILTTNIGIATNFTFSSRTYAANDYIKIYLYNPL